jgi:hypothetical protein
MVMACNDIVTVSYMGKESKIHISDFVSLLNGAACHDIDGRKAVASQTFGELIQQRGMEEECVRNALLSLRHFEDELELIDFIKSELGISC